MIKFADPTRIAMVRMCGANLAYLDATEGLNHFGYSTCVLLVKDEGARGYPRAVAVSSSQSADTVRNSSNGASVPSSSQATPSRCRQQSR
jgi:hypothetical protein